MELVELWKIGVSWDFILNIGFSGVQVVFFSQGLANVIGSF